MTRKRIRKGIRPKKTRTIPKLQNKRIHSKTQKYRGGAEHPGMVQTLFTMVGFGVSAFLIGPLYLLSEFLNLPVSSLNLISRRAFENRPETFLHLPVYKAVQGCPTKILNPDHFALQDDMYIDRKLAVVSCDKNIKYKDKVTENNPRMGDSILDIFGAIPKKRKLQHYVFQLFDYIDNIRATDEERKGQIQSLIRKVDDYKTLIKCYLIYRTLKDKCSVIKKQKTILKDEDVVKMINPFYIPCNVSFDTRIKCAWSHLFKSKFGDSEKDCRADCETCTFNNSFGRLTRKYTSILSSGGCKAGVVKSMIYTYFKYYIQVERYDEPDGDILKYLNKIPLKTHLDSSVDNVVIDRFNTFICKYDIVPVLEEIITKKIKDKLERGYKVSELLSFIRDDSKQVKAE